MENQKKTCSLGSSIEKKLTPCQIDLIVLGNGAIACPKSIYISTTDDDYLIGCSENTYRLALSLG